MIDRRHFLGVVSGIALTVLGATSAFAQEVTLRLHQFLPAQANVPKLVLDKWAADVMEQSGGRIKIEHYPSMQLGGTQPELMDQAIDGVADIVWTLVGSTPGRYPRTEVFELPFMATSAKATSRAYWEIFQKYMEDTEFKDLKILGTWVHGPGLLHTKDPVEKPTDLQGMKIRGGSRTVNILLERLGATPVGMPLPSVAEALSKGVISGTTIPWEVTASLKVPELVRNHTEFKGTSLYTLTFVLAMNKAKYESLPDDLKKVIDDNSGLELSMFAGETMEASDAPSRQIAADMGNNIITLDEAATDEWRKLAEPIYAEWVADMEAKGIDGQALIDEARAKIAEYTE